MCRVLVVEDDKNLANIIIHNLHKLGHSAIHLQTEDAAIEAIDTNGIDCMILDVGLAKGSGLNVLNHIKSINGFIPTLVVSGKDHEIPEDASNYGFMGFVPKPFEVPVFIERVDDIADTAHGIRRLLEGKAKMEHHNATMEIERTNG